MTITAKSEAPADSAGASLCTKCGINERAARGSWCRECRRAYQKAYNDRTRSRPETKAADCGICGATMEWVSGSGPDRVYCSTKCRRQADMAAQHEHRREAREREDPEKQRERRERTALFTQGLRRCNACAIVKPMDGFHRRGAGWQHRCVECVTQWGRDNRVQAKLCSWHSHLRKKFGLTAEAWARILIAQQGRCASCGDPMVDPCVDHDHSCCSHPTKTCGLCVRGLLCSPCNSGLGMFRDDPVRLRAAVEYLERRPLAG